MVTNLHGSVYHCVARLKWQVFGLIRQVPGLSNVMTCLSHPTQTLTHPLPSPPPLTIFEPQLSGL